jgi:hypothetical protein
MSSNGFLSVLMYRSIPIKDYEELLERVEDSEDVAWLKRARSKPLQYRPLEEYLAGRKRK